MSKMVLVVFHSLILTDSVFKIGKKYYPGMLVEKWKYLIKER